MHRPRNNKPQDKEFSKQGLKNLAVYLKKYYVAIFISLLFAVAGSAITVYSPDKVSEITDLITQGILSGINMDKINEICIFLVGLYVISIILSYSQSFIMGTITEKTTNKLRSDITNKINKLPLKYYDKTTVGDVLSRVTNDVDTIGQTLNRSMSSLVSGVSLLIGSLFMMFTTNVILTVTAIVSTLIGFVLMGLIVSKSQAYFEKQQQFLGQINGHIEEIYTGHSVIKVYNAQEKTNKEFKELNDKLRDAGWKAQFISGLMMPLMAFVGNFGYVAVCVVGAMLAFNNKISFGVIVAFMLYIRLFTQPLGQLAQVATSLQSTSAASKRVFEFLEEEEMVDESNNTASIEDVKGNVSFENVKFGYNEDKLIIKDFSVDIKAGQKVAIVGPTGAGKTTLVNLLMKFYDVNSGKIIIDGVAIQDLSREKVHDLFCMVLQDTWLFEGTIRDNITYNKKDVSESVIVAACKAVGIDHFIRTLPQGYDTVLDDNTNLSAGQKQLITIARAMVKNAPLLILDEATSSVDTRTEILIQEAMDKLSEGKTSFVIAHRLSTIKNADVILVMKDGDIIESGNHEELLKLKGFYAELYNSQFEKAC